MFITRFTKTDGFLEDYYYHSKNDAIHHLDLFENDDSNLYISIAVFDDTTGTVIKELSFEQHNAVPVD